MQDNQANNQDMSVEDILSSIKDILEDNTPANPIDEQKDITQTNLTEKEHDNNNDDYDYDNDDDDDIFDLTEAQIINPQNQEDIQAINLTEPKIQEEELQEEIIINTAKTDDEDNNFDFNKNTNINIDDFAYDIPTPKTEVNEADVVKEQIQEDINIENLINSLDSVINEEEQSTKAEAITTKTENKTESTTSQNDKTSVEIINNFAKMFSNSPISPQSVELNNEQIENIIQKQVAQKVIDINFDNIANAQIKKWLNDNLSTIVEKVVKEKLEEVLAKNGQ